MSNDRINQKDICPNCQYQNDANAIYCSHCSQKRKLALLSVWMMMSEFFANFINYDSKTFSTVRGLFVSGYLTNEYISNRRVSYLAPIRLFIFLMFAFFAVLSFQGFDEIKFNAQNKIDASTDKPITKDMDDDKFYNLLEKNYPTLRYKRLMDRVQSDLNDQLQLKNLQLIKLNKKLDNQLTNSEMKVKTDDQILSVQVEISNIENSFNNLEALKQAIPYDENETLNLTLFFNKKYQFKLSDVNELTNQELIEKYKITNRLEQIVVRQLLKFNKDSKAFGQFIFQNLTWAIILEILIMALFFKIFYIRSKRKYVEYFIFHLNVRSWLFLMGVLVLLIPYEFNDWISLALVLSIVIYLFMSLKRVYKQSYFMTFLKYILLSLIDFFVLLISLLIVVMISSLLY